MIILSIAATLNVNFLYDQLSETGTKVQSRDSVHLLFMYSSSIFLILMIVHLMLHRCSVYLSPVLS